MFPWPSSATLLVKVKPAVRPFLLRHVFARRRKLFYTVVAGVRHEDIPLAVQRQACGLIFLSPPLANRLLAPIEVIGSSRKQP